MSIGATIKQLRVARNLTQEQLAYNLGITSKAVSQWECGRTSPDISQIPALCNFFQISADQLLSINLLKTEKERQNILHQYYNLLRKGYIKECWDLLQEGIAKFPNDYSIMIHLSICGDNLCKFSEFTLDKKESIRNQCAEYCKRILDGCTDDFIRHTAVSNLCTYYAEKGEINKAEELAGKMPVMVMSQDFLFANIYKGAKKNEANQRLKSNLLQFMLKRFDANYKLDSEDMLYSSDELSTLREKKIALIELLFENRDFGFYSGGLSDFYEERARYYLSEESLEKALACLEKAAHLAIDFITFMQNGTYTHTSLFLKGLVEKSSNVALNSSYNQAEMILRKMKSEDYDIVRKSERFKHIWDMLEPYIQFGL